MATLHQVLAGIGAAFASVLIWLGLAGSPDAPPFQGYVEGEYLFVAPTLGGSVVSLSVRRGDSVTQGDLLFVVDPANDIAARDQAAAVLQQARDRLANLGKGKRAPEIAAVEAQKAQAESQLKLARQALERQRGLIGSTAFVQQRYDEAVASQALQQARVRELTAELAMARETLGREDEVRAATAEVAAAEAALAQAQWRLDQKTVVAPAAGLVTDTYFDPGETVTGGQPVVSLLPPGNVKVRFFVPEAMLGRFAVDTPVAIRCDGCGDAIAARVRYVSPTAEYTPPVLYNRENRSRLIFLVEAYPDKPTGALHPGQPVDVTLPGS